MYENLALVGATGVVGSLVRRLLEDRSFPYKTIKFLASARLAGKTLEFKGHQHTIEEMNNGLGDAQNLRRRFNPSLSYCRVAGGFQSGGLRAVATQ